MRPSRPLLAAIVLALACASDAPPRTRPLTLDERALRQKLGIPLDAKSVLVFGQNAHLDIDWQRTFDDYYASFVGNVFIEARQLLEQDPRAYYSIAEVAYLERHIQTHPEELSPLKAQISRGSLRIVGGGMTSPDTLLPETELLFRDFLYGARFAEDTLGAQPPTSAWLPDSFGHAATTPDMLAAAGYTSVAFSRVDGAPTIFERIIQRDRPAKPGSTAETLAQLGSADFTWKGPGGSTILAHYLSGFGLYCQGDNLDYDESLQLPGGHVGTFRGDETSFTDARIDSYETELGVTSKTPYRFVPVGCDFQHPKTGLISYLDGYNQRRYPSTHVWAVSAPFDDYAKLVSQWSDVLPVVSGDLSPYFMGFYGSRADLKRKARDAARPFFTAETFAAVLGDQGQAIVAKHAPDLSKLIRANHHDFITGTASDAVTQTEQLPLLDQAAAAGQVELGEVAMALATRIAPSPGVLHRILAFNASSVTRSDISDAAIPIVGGVVPVMHASADGKEVPMEVVGTSGLSVATVRLSLVDLPSFAYREIDFLPGAATPLADAVTVALTDGSGTPATGSAVTRVALSNTHVKAQWDKVTGVFGLTSLVIDGSEAIAQPSMLVADAHDTGGLWRLGNEMAGCELTPIAAPPDNETVQVQDGTKLSVRVIFRSASSTREASLGANDRGLCLAINTGAAQATTRTVTFAFATAPDASLRTSSPAGSVERPLERVYSPTFWPSVGWASVGGWAVLLRQSTGVRMSTPGHVEIMVARDARSEQCDVEGGTGSDTAVHRVEWRIERVTNPAAAERASQAFNRPIAIELVDAAKTTTADLPTELALAQIEGDGVISAIKPAERGGGIILRALLFPGPVHVHLPSGWVGKSLTVVDIAERDNRSLGVSKSLLDLDTATYGSVASVRLR